MNYNFTGYNPLDEVDPIKLRGFEKTKNNIGAPIPERATQGSAGYDFELQYDLEILHGQHSVAAALGIKAYMMQGEVLTLYIRSSLGFKKGLVLSNGTGIIDSDYYDNEDNEGEIFVKLYNSGKEDIILKKGTRVIQGLFIQTLATDNSFKINKKRTGGLGSTGK